MPNIKVHLTETTWQALASIGAMPRELLIAFSRNCPDFVRSLSQADLQKFSKTITPVKIAQIVLRSYLQRSGQLTRDELASLGKPASLAAENLLMRAIVHDYPENYAKHLQTDSATLKKSKPFEKRPKQLLIKLTSAENDTFRSFAARLRMGPSELGGLLLERFAHGFAPHIVGRDAAPLSSVARRAKEDNA